MKKAIFVVAIAIIALALAGCGSIFVPAPGYFSDVPITLRGEATSRLWLGMFGADHPVAEAIARDAGITTIASVERFVRPGILGLWIDSTVIVTGH